jgi:hypothetical protein
MTNEELLEQRFKVIADYPYSPHKIGDIIQSNHGGDGIHQTTIQYKDEFGEEISQQNLCKSKSFEKYPTLFRKLEWWEERDSHDLPEYIKNTLFGTKLWIVYKVIEYGSNTWKQFYALTSDSKTGQIFLKNAEAIPSTEEEYLRYKEKTK